MKSACMSSESKEKTIDIYDYDGPHIAIGDAVTVCASMSMGKKAVWLSFGMPLILIIAGVTLGQFQVSELASAGIAIAVLCIYYSILRLMKNKLSEKFRFWIKQKI